jgi:hypothetical protein
VRSAYHERIGGVGTWFICLEATPGFYDHFVNQLVPDPVREHACFLGRVLWKEKEHDDIRNQQHTTAASSAQFH